MFGARRSNAKHFALRFGRSHQDRNDATNGHSHTKCYDRNDGRYLLCRYFVWTRNFCSPSFGHGKALFLKRISNNWRQLKAFFGRVVQPVKTKQFSRDNFLIGRSIQLELENQLGPKFEPRCHLAPRAWKLKLSEFCSATASNYQRWRREALSVEIGEVMICPQHFLLEELQHVAFPVIKSRAYSINREHDHFTFCHFLLSK